MSSDSSVKETTCGKIMERSSFQSVAPPLHTRSEPSTDAKPSRQPLQPLEPRHW